MKLADKIIKLRKQFNWSQEELADKLDVSRQSVSKWESAASIPDMNKIIKLSDLFSVSTDYLLKDEIEDLQTTGFDREEGILKVSLETVNEYLKSKLQVSQMVAKATLLFIYSVLPMFLLLAISELEDAPFTENLASGIGMTFLLIMVSLGVVLIISSSSNKRHYDLFEENEFELEYGVKGIIKDKSEAFKGDYTRHLSISVTLFIISSVPLILSGLFDAPDWLQLVMLMILIIIVGIGVYTLIPVSTKKGALDCILGIGDYSTESRTENKRAVKVGAFYWPLVTAIYLGWSFLTMDWHITWIVWPVAGVSFAAVIGLIGLFDTKE